MTDTPWTKFTVCVECAEIFTPIFTGQTRHPCCHTCQRPSTTCVDCMGERRAHRAHVARLRHAALSKRKVTTR